MQLYAYDVVEEGAGAILEGASLLGAEVLLPAVSYCDSDIEIAPGRGGELRHNRTRRVHHHEALFPPGVADYPLELPPTAPRAPESDGGAALAQLLDAARERGRTVVPWLTLLTPPVAYERPESCVVNPYGERVPGWLCPSRCETLAYVCAVIADVLAASRPPAVFIDRIRFPEWGPRGLADACGCFCEACRDAARVDALDLVDVRRRLLDWLARVSDDPDGVAEAIQHRFSSGLRTVRSAGSALPLEWLAFRQRAVERLAAAVYGVARTRGAEVWLDVWPPSYGWLLGQDLARLAPYGSVAKPFTYHTWGGGADVASFIASISDDPAVRQRWYEAHRAFFAFPGPSTFEEYVEEGLFPAFITEELVLAREMLAGRCRLAAGLQTWGLGPGGAQTAVDHARRADPDGIFFHCFGWATWDELAEAGAAARATALPPARARTGAPR